MFWIVLERQGKGPMKATPLTVAAALAIALTACSGGGEKAPEPSISSEPATEEATETAVTTASVENEDGIPPELRGRWGLSPADCTSTKGDAKGLLTVSAYQLVFYEAVAKLAEIKASGPGSVTASFDFSGEGQSWNLDVALSSHDGGKTLVRKDTGPDAAPAPLTYTKCP